GLGVGLGVEIPLGASPAAEGAHHAADELPDAALARGGAERAAEVFRGDDVGRRLRPELRDLDVLLLEDDFPLLAADHGGADLPVDLVEGIDTGAREAALEDHPLGRLAEGERGGVPRGARLRAWRLAALARSGVCSSGLELRFLLHLTPQKMTGHP